VQVDERGLAIVKAKPCAQYATVVENGNVVEAVLAPVGEHAVCIAAGEQGVA
jgi:hypothetical protein